MKRLALFFLLALSARATTTVAGTLCGGTQAQVTLRRWANVVNSSGTGTIAAAQDPQVGPRNFTAGVFSYAFTTGEDGSYYVVRVVCPASSPATDTTYRYLIPQSASTLTPAQVSVATDGSVALGRGYYWDDVAHAWKTLSAPVVASASGTGTVTSVGLTGDGTVFNSSVSGSPVTTNGNLAPSLHTQSANRVFAGPASGSAAAPTFRALTVDDIPNAGGGGPPPSSAALGDFWVVRTSATVLTIGPACSSTYPCKIAFGTTVYTLTTPATATISAGTDTAYIYVSDAQVLTVGVNSAALTCSGCTRTAGITSFPATAFPLWNWTSTSGTWDIAGGSDRRTIVQKGADPLAGYLLSSADTQLKNGVVFSPSIGATFGSFESGATALSGSKTSCVDVNWAGTITQVTVKGDVSGSATVDVLTKASSWTGTASAASITAAAVPALSSSAAYSDSTLTGWTKPFTAGTTFCFALTSPTTVAGVSISLKTTVQ